MKFRKALIVILLITMGTIIFSSCRTTNKLLEKDFDRAELQYNKILNEAKDLKSFPRTSNPDGTIRDALDILLREGLIKTGDPLVILSDALYEGTNVDAILLREA